MSQIIKHLLALLCLSIGVLLSLSSDIVLGSVEAREFYSQQQAIEILKQTDVTQQLTSFANKRSANDRVQLLNQWQSSQNIEPIIQEKLLYEATLFLRQSVLIGSESTSAEELATYQSALSKLLTYQSTAFIPLRDGGYEIQVIAYEVAASAKATLLHWQIEEIFQQSTKLLNNSPTRFLAELNLHQLSLEKEMGYIKTINDAAQAELTALKTAVVQSQKVLPMRVLQSLAIKTEDHQLYSMLIAQYTHSVQHQALMINMLSQLPTSLSSKQHIELLLAATSKAGLRNSSIIALAPFVDHDLKVKNFLNEELANKLNGGAAAKALSLSKDSLTIEMLGTNLKHSNTLIVRRSLLALYLNKSYQAKLLLNEFQQSATNEQLKKEISQWLK